MHVASCVGKVQAGVNADIRCGSCLEADSKKKNQIQPINQRETSEHKPTFQTTAHIVNKKVLRAVYTIGPTGAVSFFSPLSFSRMSLRYWRSSALAWTQYTSRVCRPPPQRPVRLPRRRSCWLSNRSMRQSLHSVVLQVNLRRRWEKEKKT